MTYSGIQDSVRTLTPFSRDFPSLHLPLSKPFRNMWLKPMETKNPRLYHAISIYVYNIILPHYTLIDIKYHVMSVLCIQNIYKPNAPNILIT